MGADGEDAATWRLTQKALAEEDANTAGRDEAIINYRRRDR